MRARMTLADTVAVLAVALVLAGGGELVVGAPRIDQ